MKHFTFKEPEKPILDLMGNAIRRGHVVAFTKSGRGERSMRVGVVTHITRRTKKLEGYSHSMWVNGTEHRIGTGCNDSVVILHDPLYSLNADRITKLFESIESSKGKEHGDWIAEHSYVPWGKSKREYWDTFADWKACLPANYEFGVPLDEEQIISVPDKKALAILAKQKEKAREDEKVRAKSSEN